jgi:hypothetical protein
MGVCSFDTKCPTVDNRQEWTVSDQLPFCSGKRANTLHCIPFHSTYFQMRIPALYIYIYIYICVCVCVRVRVRVHVCVKVKSRFNMIVLRYSLIRPPLWSSGQSSWLQIRRPGFDSRH